MRAFGLVLAVLLGACAHAVALATPVTAKRPPPRVTAVDAGAPADAVAPEEDPGVAWRTAAGVTAWPPAGCRARALGQVIDECRCQRTITLARTPLLVCGRPVEVLSGTGVAERTLVLRADGNATAAVFDELTSVEEDDALPGGVDGPRLALDVVNDALVLDDKGSCPPALAAIAEVVRDNAGARTRWPAEAAAYRAVCARRGRYVLDHGRITRAPASAAPASTAAPP